MKNFIQKILGFKQKKIKPIVKVYINGKEKSSSQNKNILLKPNLTDNIKIPSFSDEYDNNIKIQDLQDLRRNYVVNLYSMKCTCPIFLEKNKHFPPNDLRRVCQHLKDAICDNLKKGNPFLTKVISRFQNKPNNLFYYIFLDERFIIYFSESSFWVNIIAEFNPEKKYAFNIDENRWSGAGVPDKSEQLISEILNIMAIK